MNDKPTVNEAVASYEIVKMLVELGEQKDYKGSDESFLVRCCRIIKKAKEMELVQIEERKRHEGKEYMFTNFEKLTQSSDTMAEALQKILSKCTDIYSESCDGCMLHNINCTVKQDLKSWLESEVEGE